MNITVTMNVLDTRDLTDINKWVAWAGKIMYYNTYKLVCKVSYTMYMELFVLAKK